MTLKSSGPLQTILLALCLHAGTAAADVVAVVSSKSAVRSLSKSQVADIFFGKIGRFPDGGVAVPFDLAENLPERSEFYEKLVGKSPAQIKAYWSRIIFTGRGEPPKTVSSSVEMKKRLAEEPGAIGYMDAKLVDASVRVLF
ncbi:MAG: type 2 periplasmic-binding domain-containing protein [Steroidobacteraceae bacterium]